MHLDKFQDRVILIDDIRTAQELFSNDADDICRHPALEESAFKETMIIDHARGVILNEKAACPRIPASGNLDHFLMSLLNKVA
jgi:hypothetical protein